MGGGGGGCGLVANDDEGATEKKTGGITKNKKKWGPRSMREVLRVIFSETSIKTLTLFLIICVHIPPFV